MTTQKSLQRRLLLGFIILAGCLTLMQTPAYAEPYIAGQAGVTIPGSLSNVDVTTAAAPSGTKFSDLDLHNSLVAGVKLGYYSQSVRWFGVETEAFYTTPHIKQQSVTITYPAPFVCASTLTPSCSTPSPGDHLRVFTWAPINLMARYPGRRFQPYIGVGPGLFFARIHDLQTGESQSDTKLGLNAQAGLRYFLERHVALFGEYKFNYARFNFKETANLDGFNATYKAQLFVFGISYHF